MTVSHQTPGAEWPGLLGRTGQAPSWRLGRDSSWDCSEAGGTFSPFPGGHGEAGSRATGSDKTGLPADFHWRAKPPSVHVLKSHAGRLETWLCVRARVKAARGVGRGDTGKVVPSRTPSALDSQMKGGRGGRGGASCGGTGIRRGGPVKDDAPNGPSAGTLVTPQPREVACLASSSKAPGRVSLQSCGCLFGTGGTSGQPSPASVCGPVPALRESLTSLLPPHRPASSCRRRRRGRRRGSRTWSGPWQSRGRWVPPGPHAARGTPPEEAS